MYPEMTAQQREQFKRERQSATRLQLAVMIVAGLAMRDPDSSVEQIARKSLRLSQELMDQNDAIDAAGSLPVKAPA